MKSLLFSFFTLFTVIINAQDIGFHIGINYSSVLDKDGSRNVTEYLNFTNGIGLNIGVDLQKEISNNLFLQSGVTYSQKGYKSDRVQDGPLISAARDVKLNYLELPLNFVYGSMNSNITPFVSGGAYLAYLLGGKFDFEDTEYETELKSEFKNFDVGANIAGGIKINSIYFELGYDFGLLNVSNNPSEESLRKTRNLYLKLFVWL